MGIHAAPTCSHRAGCGNIVRVDSAILRQATYGTARIGLHTAFSEKLKERNGGNAIPFYQKFTSS
eukprot:COSAG02_NODE_48683_length_332_cov_0.656652_1_plen_64_part_01